MWWNFTSGSVSSYDGLWPTAKCHPRSLILIQRSLGRTGQDGFHDISRGALAIPGYR